MLKLSDFSKNTLTLISGVTLAQGVVILTSFVLARIYTPAEFGIYAFFISVSAIFSPNINGRYENAIILPKSEKESYNIVILGFIINSISSFIFLVIILLFKNNFLKFFNVEELDFWVYFLPLVIWLSGIFNSLSLINTKMKSYKNIAKATVSRTLGASFVQIVSKSVMKSINGLVLGNIISQFIGNGKLISSAGGFKKFIDYYDKNEIRLLAKKYIDFPKFSLPGSILNTTSQNIINMATPKLYKLEIVGHYSLVKRLLALPSSLISSSVSKVYWETSAAQRRDKGNSTQILKDTLTKLVLIAVIVYGILFFVVEDIFVFFYGEIWRNSGIYAKIMLPSFAAAFIVSPVSITMEIYGKQKIFMYWQILRFISILVLLLFTYSRSYEFVKFLYGLNWIIVGQYLILLILVNRAVKGRIN